jgi:hypothetical protein
MKRTVVVLGILGLVYAVALPGASAQMTLLKEDFNSGTFKGVNGVYMQGRGDAIRSDASILPFMVRDGVLTSSAPDSTTGSDGVSPDNDPPGIRYLLLTGDPAWADVSIQAKIKIDSQNTGGVALVLRAAPKTKPEDPDTWYEFRYTTGNSPAPADEETTSSIPAPATNPNLRIMKVVKGKWTILAENDAAQEATIPAINAAGDDNETGAIFRFTAKGDLLQGFVSKDGATFTKFLEAHDGELKAGLIGLSHYDYNPIFDDLLVETVP